MGLVIGIQGDEKTGKTTFALTAPDPTWYFEFDIKGLDRAVWRFKSKQIKHTSYPQPQQFLVTKNSLKEPQRLMGIKEIWYKYLQDYLKFLEDETYQTGVIDTATTLWSICHDTYLQEKQEVQIAKGEKGKLRESLSEVEYGEPNNRFRALINAAHNANKNLVLVHYETDVYEQRLLDGVVKSFRTGKRRAEGFKYTPKLADMMVKTERVLVPAIKGSTASWKMRAIVIEPGMALVPPAFELPEPTWDSLVGIIKMVRGED